MTEGIDLLATGTLTWETSALVQRLPLDDRVDLAGVDAILDAALRVVERGGGSAANVAVAAAAAGLRVAFAGRVGDDEAGRRCVNDLLERGIHTRVERAPGRSTKRSVLLVEAGTARVQFRVDVPPRSAPPLPARDIGDDLLLGARWLHLDRVSEAGPELLRRRAGRPSSLDLHDLPHRPAARERLAAMLPGLALLQVREGVLPGLCALLAGGPDHGGCRDGEAAVDAPLSDADLARYLERLSATVPCVVTTRGERGGIRHRAGSRPVPRAAGPGRTGPRFDRGR